MPHTRTELIICEHCDSVFTRIPLDAGQTAYCTCCDGVLAKGYRLDYQQLLALTITAALLLVFSNAFPVIQISFEGLANETTLADSVRVLAQGEITPIAAVAGLTIILAPALQIGVLGWLLAHAIQGRRAPGFKRCMKTLEHIRPWSMLEVCLLGILVAIVKLAGMLEVHPGLGLWTLAMLTVLMILMSGKSIRRLWRELPEPDE
ncbi:paraquat-inducible protein A [Pseudomonas bharatica]|uniref:paraquat-inducible protein A n=1 Tax=Pseudomonas bharatica TaxID=2692112 RepID=UPI003B289981